MAGGARGLEDALRDARSGGLYSGLPGQGEGVGKVFQRIIGGEGALRELAGQHRLHAVVAEREASGGVEGFNVHHQNLR